MALSWYLPMFMFNTPSGEKGIPMNTAKVFQVRNPFEVSVLHRTETDIASLAITHVFLDSVEDTPAAYRALARVFELVPSPPVPSLADALTWLDHGRADPVDVVAEELALTRTAAPKADDRIKRAIIASLREISRFIPRGEARTNDLYAVALMARLHRVADACRTIKPCLE